MTIFHRLDETGGWVRGAKHHHSPNSEPGMSVPAGVSGVVMHTMVGNLGGTDSVFMNPGYQASAHFGIGQDGALVQWVPVNGGVAWHCMAGNYYWYGIEHADNGHPGNPLTDAQLSRSAQLVELLARVGNFPLQVTDSTAGEGYGVHHMGGAAWGGHTCPDNTWQDGTRSHQRHEIIRRAKIIREHGRFPAADPKPPGTDWQWTVPGAAQTVSSYRLAPVASRHKVAVSTLLRLTAIHNKGYEEHLAWYLNAEVDWDVTVPQGEQLWYRHGSDLTDQSLVSDGTQPLAGIAAGNQCPVSVLLCLTAIHSGRYSPGMAGVINGRDWSAHLPAGAKIWFPAHH